MVIDIVGLGSEDLELVHEEFGGCAEVLVQEDLALHETLVAAGVTALDPAWVEQYKREQVRLATPLIPVETDEGRWRVMKLLDVVQFLNMSFWILGGTVAAGLTALIHWPLAIVVFAVCAGCALGSLSLLQRLETYELKGRATWHRRIVRDLDELPENVAELARSILERSPETVFIIEELFQNKQVIDPVLIAELDGECAPIAYWED